MKRGDLVLADASSVPEYWFGATSAAGVHARVGATKKMLVVLVERMPDIDGWRCYSPKYKTNFEFWEFELETR